MSKSVLAVPGAEFAPIPPGALEWRVNALGLVLRERAPAGAPDLPGPHTESFRGQAHPRLPDLTDCDTALLVLRRLLSLPSAPVRAAALGSVALSGRWSTTQALQLGELCRRTWGPKDNT